ncbi:MAG TPA: hypothetical protein PLB73_08425 [Leptospiraceae bacterium]|nr:hypothetical protein [Leptospiraceae bacterium]
MAHQTLYSSHASAPVIQQTIIDRYAELFLHNPADYIKHNGNNWFTVKGNATPAVLAAHLRHEIVIGLSPLKDGTIRWLALDFDAHNGESYSEISADLLAIVAALRRAGIQCHPEASGRGFHVWIFFAVPVRPNFIPALKQFVGNRCEVCAGKTRIRIPMGVYQKDRSRFCGFLDHSLTEIPDQFEYLKNIKPTKPDQIVALNHLPPQGPAAVKTKITVHSWYRNKPATATPKKDGRQVDRENLLFHFEIQPFINNRFSSVPNLKHRLVLYLGFALQLTAKETVNLRVRDLSENGSELKVAAPRCKAKTYLITDWAASIFRGLSEGKAPNVLVFQEGRKNFRERSVQKILQRFFESTLRG